MKTKYISGVIFLLALITVWMFYRLPLEKIETAGLGIEETHADNNEKIKKDNDMMNYKTATFGAGCFWGVEANFQELKGVVTTEVGFMGGHTENPSYKDVCYTETGHAEVVHLKYDPNVISYQELVKKFFEMHDPTQLNRQGPDVGDQYRSVIFYYDDDQKAIAESSLKKIEAAKVFSRPLATQVVKAGQFYTAEDYHQDYYKNKGIAPSCGLGIGKKFDFLTQETANK